MIFKSVIRVHLPQKGKIMKNKASISDYLYLVPAFLIYTSILIIPALWSIFISFHKWNGIRPMEFVGIKNFIHLFTSDRIFLISLKNNFLWIVLTLSITIVIAMGLALTFNRNFVGRAFFRSYFYFPYTLSIILIAVVWRRMYDPTTGLLNELLRLINLDGLTSQWTANPKISLLCVFIASAWQSVGQPMILFLAGLQTVDPELLEAAEIDGASGIKRFFSITLPLMKETFVIVIATQIITSMKVFDIVMGMTAGGPANSTQTLATYMHSQAFLWDHWGRATAISVVMLIIMMFIIIPYIVFTVKRR
jgi:raffinose/stachyose/melibiose transport system permease protein